MKYTLFILFLFVSLLTNAQTTLKGRVVDKVSKLPIDNVSVYISNSSAGSRTDSTGRFKFSTQAFGQFDLILSIVGYATKVLSVNSNDKLENLIIELESKSTDLPEVILRTYVKDGWKVWGKSFQNLFIGTYPLNSDCKILNPEVIHFQFKKMDSVLIAFADETILIENKKIGYLLHYDLIEFKHDFVNSRTLFQGYPLFENLPNSEGRKVQRARLDIYKGSVMHFLRSLFVNKLLENNFEVRHALKTIEKDGRKIPIDGNVNYYSTDKIELDVYGPLLKGDSIAYGVSDKEAELYFKNYLQVTYTNKQVPYYYSGGGNLRGSQTSSEITLLLKKPLPIYANGSSFSSNNLLISGYWGWAEKLGYLLPYDYIPPKK